MHGPPLTLTRKALLASSALMSGMVLGRPVTTTRRRTMISLTMRYASGSVLVSSTVPHVLSCTRAASQEAGLVKPSSEWPCIW